ncbi:substrate-binding domain-containing protein [Luteolibacter sp. LG18]|uniref:substrate-binding domain-containing protein n=1 Tax=Luteolibacter sp. LG18 TaxID=2819286 RepID=UPI0030C721E5
MHLPRAISISESTAEVIKTGLQARRWPTLPGERHLAAQLGVSRATVRNALALLTEQGHLSSPSQGLKRSVRSLPSVASADSLRVDLLLGRDYHTMDRGDHRFLAMLGEAISRGGHVLAHDQPDLAAVRRKHRGLGRFMNERGADARIVYLGVWEDLDWFSRQDVPVLALGGRSLGIEIDSVGIDSSLALREAMQVLTGRGHRRIALLCERFVREAPTPGRMARAFTEELAAVSVTASPYNLPAWDETPEGLQTVLEELFRITPPTAIIVNNALALSGLLSFCNRRGLRIPEHLSVLVMESSAEIEWFRPKLGMLGGMSITDLVAGVMEWLDNPSRQDRAPGQKLLPSYFIEGESIAAPFNGRLPTGR